MYVMPPMVDGWRHTDFLKAVQDLIGESLRDQISPGPFVVGLGVGWARMLNDVYDIRPSPDAPLEGRYTIRGRLLSCSNIVGVFEPEDLDEWEVSVYGLSVKSEPLEENP